MHIDAFKEVINACRYCFMCRHLSAVGNVTFRESDTPRGRALMADTVRMRPERLATPDFADALYASDLSGANRFHCVSGYDEIGLQLALRRDLVDAGLAPADVAAVAERLKTTASWTREGDGDTLYFVDPRTAARPGVTAAMQRLAAAAGVKLVLLSGGCLGKALAVLGYADAAETAMRAFADAVAASGAKTLIVANPAAYDALANDFPARGIKLAAAPVASSAWLADLAAAGTIQFKSDAADIAYLDSDYLKNYARCDGPRRLLAALHVNDVGFGYNNEESYGAGEGALVLDELRPDLVARLVARVKELAAPGVRLAVASAATADRLAAAGLDVATLEELAGERLC